MLPAQTLDLVVSLFAYQQKTRDPYLRDSQSSPFILPQQFQCAFGRVEVVARNGLEHSLWELNMSIFVVVVRVSEPVRFGFHFCSSECISPRGVADRLDELIQTYALLF